MKKTTINNPQYISKKSIRGVSYTNSDARKVVLNEEEWANEVSSIKVMIKSGATLSFIGKKYGVSRQRIHQVLTQFSMKVWAPEEGSK